MCTLPVRGMALIASIIYLLCAATDAHPRITIFTVNGQGVRSRSAVGDVGKTGVDSIRSHVVHAIFETFLGYKKFFGETKVFG